MRGLQELQPAVFHVGHPPRTQLDLEQVTVMRRPHQHGVVPQPAALLDRAEDRVDDLPRLVRDVIAAHETRATHSARRIGPVGVQGQPIVAGPDLVCQVQQRLARAEVALQPYRPRPGQVVGESMEMTTRRTPKSVHRLRIVADHRQPDTGGPQSVHDVDLDRVDVLIFVDEHVIPTLAQRISHRGRGQQRPPGQQQIVEIEQATVAFARQVAAHEVEHGLDVWLAPGEIREHDVAGRPTGVHRPRIDVRQRRGPWPSATRVSGGQAELVPQADPSGRSRRRDR